MCGIVGAYNWKKALGDANDWVKGEMSDQLSRGKEGSGMVLFGSKRKVITFRNTDMSGAFVDLKLERAPGILFHHRWPTSSPNWIGQTHPIEVDNAELKWKWLVIHNGIISNVEERRKAHEKAGYRYTTHFISQEAGKDIDDCNDSEALAIDIVRSLEGKADKIESLGPAAWAAVQIDKETEVATGFWFGRNSGNPLMLDLDKKNGYIRFSSEGTGESIAVDKAYCFCLTTKKLKEFDLKIPEFTPHLKPTSYGWTGGKNYGSGGDDYHFHTPEAKGKDKDKEVVGFEVEGADAMDANMAKLLGEGDAELAIDALEDHAHEILGRAVVRFEDALVALSPISKSEFRTLSNETVSGIANAIREMKRSVNREIYETTMGEAKTAPGGFDQTTIEGVKEALSKDKEEVKS